MNVDENGVGEKSFQWMMARILKIGVEKALFFSLVI